MNPQGRIQSTATAAWGSSQISRKIPFSLILGYFMSKMTSSVLEFDSGHLWDFLSFLPWFPIFATQHWLLRFLGPRWQPFPNKWKYENMSDTCEKNNQKIRLTNCACVHGYNAEWAPKRQTCNGQEWKWRYTRRDKLFWIRKYHCNQAFSKLSFSVSDCQTPLRLFPLNISTDQYISQAS